MDLGQSTLPLVLSPDMGWAAWLCLRTALAALAALAPATTATHLVLRLISTPRRIGCSNPAGSIGRGTAKHARQSRSVCGLLYVVQTVFGRMVECSRVKCA